ncbi:MAG: ABC transporter ATP-binding protein [Firmicutes bacterium HGW-Firmicutes-14]|nr:MAG: ABC transporter ATP-binding protein [Firmicutes bacterium HGW-Firmicutes-14]
MGPLLKVEKIHTYIGQYHILQGIDFEVHKGEVTVLLGRNGAGKTTALRSIMGLNPVSKGRILFKNEEIHTLPTYRIAQKGIGYVPEDHGIFGELTVEENFVVAGRSEDDSVKERQEWILVLFPDLKKVWNRPASNLSGGEKQMLSIARAFVNDDELLLIDEPSKGLAPIMVEKLIQAIHEIKEKRTVVLVEQHFYMAACVGERFYIIDDGVTVTSGEMAELKGNSELKKQYLGIA